MKKDASFSATTVFGKGTGSESATRDIYLVVGNNIAASSYRVSVLVTALGRVITSSEKSGHGISYSPILIDVVWITPYLSIEPVKLVAGVEWADSARIWLIGGSMPMVDDS